MKTLLGIVPLSEANLPIKLDVRAGESSVGYCLRLALANGVSLAQLHRHLGLAENQAVSIDDASLLAAISGMDVALIERMLPTRMSRARVGWLYCGHELRFRSLLRFTSPQICPLCVRQSAYARAQWDISLTTVCAAHQVYLIDDCPSCKKPIRWNRPAMEWGHCKHHLTSIPTDTPDVGHQMKMQCIADCLFENRPLSPGSWASDLAAGISLDGWFGLVLAFGMLERAGQVATLTHHNSIPRSPAARLLVGRAYRRINTYLNTPAELRNVLADEVQEMPLIAMIKSPVREADRLIACRVYASVFGEAALRVVLRRWPVLLQMSLFEDAI